MEVNVVCDNCNSMKKQVIKAIKILNNVQSYFHFNLNIINEEICMEEYINWRSYCNNYKISSDKYLICVVQKAFDDNWFLHQNKNLSIITTYNWKEKFAPPSLYVFLIYEIAQVVMGFILGFEEEKLIKLRHTNAVGCIYDLCRKKSEIKYGMAVGRICSECRSVLEQISNKEDVLNSIEKILKYVRSETIEEAFNCNINKAIIIDHSNKDEDVYQFGIESALNELNIEYLVYKRVNSRLLLNMKDSIEKSSFLIVRVDSENLSEYFELGLAMGLDKEVLIISEHNLIIDIPYELKKWRHITYYKGEYAELKEKILKYICKKYFS